MLKVGANVLYHGSKLKFLSLQRSPAVEIVWTQKRTANSNKEGGNSRGLLEKDYMEHSEESPNNKNGRDSTCGSARKEATMGPQETT